MINNDHIPLKCIKMQQSQVCKEQKIELKKIRAYSTLKKKKSKSNDYNFFFLWMITYFWIEKQFR